MRLGWWPIPLLLVLGCRGEPPAAAPTPPACLGLGPAGTCESAGPPTSGADLNVRGEPLEVCSTDPMTGWTRSGTCTTGPDDGGVHVVCAEMTEQFLAFTKDRGNDLSTQAPEFRFPGLQPGDRWCLCASRWDEAFEAGVAPPPVLEATHATALRVVDRARLGL